MGGSFRTDHDGNIFPPKLDGAQIDYTDYRAGVEFKTDPAPYLRVSISGQF